MSNAKKTLINSVATAILETDGDLTTEQRRLLHDVLIEANFMNPTYEHAVDLTIMMDDAGLETTGALVHKMVDLVMEMKI